MLGKLMLSRVIGKKINSVRFYYIYSVLLSPGP